MNLVDQLSEGLRIFTNVLFDERNAVLREKLPRCVTGASARLGVKDDVWTLVHGE